jgi:exo-1,4-beta-D-glucosaminidase
VTLEVKAEYHHEAGKSVIKLKLKNPSSSVAFQIHPRVTKGKDGDDLVPIFWDDNYFSLLLGEEKTVSVTFDPSDLDGKDPVLELEGFNITPGTIKLSH